uniref:(northern house mosquito) hypothetical protein n=1 Tax=Culex pipiens TaxID=7175 RepID=A0A8D8G6X8_CULPI
MVTGAIQPNGSKNFDESDRSWRLVLALSMSKLRSKLNASSWEVHLIPRALTASSSWGSLNGMDSSCSAPHSSSCGSFELHFRRTKPPLSRTWVISLRRFLASSIESAPESRSST